MPMHEYASSCLSPIHEALRQVYSTIVIRMQFVKKV
jgi:hypothetical protein